MKVLNVYYKTKPGMRKAYFDEVCKAGVPELSRKEEGNIKYDYYFSERDEDEILLVEHWKDEEAFQIHTQQEHFKALQAIKEEYVESARLEKYIG